MTPRSQHADSTESRPFPPSAKDKTEGTKQNDDNQKHAARIQLNLSKGKEVEERRTGRKGREDRQSRGHVHHHITAQ